MEEKVIGLKLGPNARGALDSVNCELTLDVGDGWNVCLGRGEAVGRHPLPPLKNLLPTASPLGCWVADYALYGLFR